MKIFDLENVLYSENDKFRSFLGKDFNFVLMKSKKCSICYGEVESETPLYDPISPQEVDITIDKLYDFNKSFNMLKKLFNISENDGVLSSYSTVSTVNINIDDIYMDNIDEVTKLFNYLNELGFYISMNIKFNQACKIIDFFRIKLYKINNIHIDIEEFKCDELINSLKLFYSKDINIFYNFVITNKNYDEFYSLINNGFLQNDIFLNIIFKNPISKSNRKKIVNILNAAKNVAILNTKTIKNDDVGFNNVVSYQDGLFKCYINFSKKQVSYNKNSKGIKFNEINDIKSYWNSNLFNEYRCSLIENMCEE